MQRLRVSFSFLSRSLGVGLALAALAVSAAAGPLTPVFQDRSVGLDQRKFWNVWDPDANPFFPDFDPPSVSLLVFAETPVASAPAFGDFQETVSTSPGSVASQGSTIGDRVVEASGSYFAIVGSSQCTGLTPGFYCVVSGSVDGSSEFFLTFSVDEATPFTLTGSIQHPPPGGGLFGTIEGASHLSLGGPGVSVSATAPDPTCSPQPGCLVQPVVVDVSGTLMPGGYVLQADTGGSGTAFCVDVDGGVTCFSDATGGSYSLRLTLDEASPPVPALGIPAAGGMAAVLVWVGRRARRRQR